MTSQGFALARAELIRALTAYSGYATADGAVDGTTIIDTNLIGRNDFVTEKTIIIMSGAAQYEDRGEVSFDNTTGVITVVSAFKDSTGVATQIKAGTLYRILNISSVEIDVATINTKIGTNADAPGTTTLFAWLAKLFTQGGQGLVYYGKVTTYTDTTHFKVSGLAGFGNDYFNNFRVYVVRDAAGAGAAPQGQMQPVSDYVSSDGTFVHTAFTIPLAVNDEVLILHQRVAEIKDLIDRLGTAADAAGTTTVFARLKQIVDTYLADGTIGLAALKTILDAILVDTGTTLPTDLATIIAYVDELETRLSAARAGYLDELDFDLAAALATIIAYVDDLETRLSAARAGYLDELGPTNIPADTDPKVMGRTQIFEKSITSAANAGDVTVATITDQPCQIESVIIHADAAQTANMTSCGVFGGAGKVITFISATDAVQANLDAADKQIGWVGAVRLDATKTIVISLVGTGATPVDLTIVVKYRACANGGYLT